MKLTHNIVDNSEIGQVYACLGSFNIRELRCPVHDRGLQQKTGLGKYANSRQIPEYYFTSLMLSFSSMKSRPFASSRWRVSFSFFCSR